MGLMLILTSYPSRSNALTPVSMTAVRSFMGAQSMSRAAAKTATNGDPKKSPAIKRGRTRRILHGGGRKASSWCGNGRRIQRFAQGSHTRGEVSTAAGSGARRDLGTAHPNTTQIRPRTNSIAPVISPVINATCMAWVIL
jgi:hypothetical protein